MQKMIKNESLIMNRNSFLEKFTGSIAYQVENEQKSKFLFEELSYLTQHHLERCEKYANFVRTFKAHETRCTLSDIPFFSVRAFKEFELLSIDKKQIFKTMISSGTSGQAVSKIYLDQETASLQSRVLTNLMRDVTGPTRLPMLIIDAPNSVKNRTNFSARGAGIIGFSLYGKDVTFALNDDYSLNMDIVKSFFNRYVNKQVFVFGFTFMVWKCFLEKPLEFKILIDKTKSVLLHGGGWKRLSDEAVSPLEFKTRVEQTLGIKKVVNYYGLVEQTGSLYFECEHGYLHSSVYSDVITRCPRDLSEVSHGDEGVIQVLSCIPRSYPGHSLLTDDLGVIHGVDDCKCGRKGKYFSINGRLEAAEVRGCSDAAK
jgi:phenylacetate-coenzyme A ligase PaaK-like adenylate-forming protein